jgi:glycosyltransferase involved in cell wall biosynthesis
MKIAIISTSKIPSTTANSIQVMKVCQSYQQLGHDVILFVPGQEILNFSEIKTHYGLTEEFEIHWIKSIRSLNRYDFVIKSLINAKRWGCDVVHTWTPQAAWFTSLIKTPYLMELHEMPSGKFGPTIMKWVIKNKSKKRFLVITNALKIRYEAYFQFKFPEKEVVIAPDGVDLERYLNLPDPKEARKQLNFPDKKTAIYTGHLYPGRGMKILITLAEKFPTIQFLWVGGKPDDVLFWRAEIIKHGFENIILTGFVENQKIPLYQAAGEILLMPYETSVSGSSGGNTVDICSPMKMFEYMAAKRAILSSDLPVLHEVLTKEMAVFCSPDRMEEWINGFSELVKNEYLRVWLAENAFSAVKKFSWINRTKSGMSEFLDEH